MSSYEEAEPEYLGPDFDPLSVTVPRLRSILLEHAVNYPASAKKSDLVDLYNEHVAPHVKNIRKQRARTKRSTRGIEDVPSISSQASTADTEESETVPPLPTPATTSRRTTRRVTRAQSQELSEAAPAPSVASSRRTSKHPRASEEADERPPSRRRTRASATPSVKVDDSEPESWHRYDAESPFSADNPFQSGGSPVPDAKTPRDHRRKSRAPEHREKGKSGSSRRKTEQAHRVVQQEDGIVVPSRKTFEMPVARPKKEPTPESDGAEAGEEFTAEEQEELAQEQEATGQLDVLPPRRVARRSHGSGPAKNAFWAILVASLAGVAYMYRQEQIAVGYCGIGRPPRSVAEILPAQISDTLPQVADYLAQHCDSIMPQCYPCPQHAWCGPDMQTTCEPGFILKPHPLSKGNIIPLPPTCEPDGAKARRVKALADRAIDELRERNAKYECGELDTDGKKVKSPETSEQELKQSISSKRSRRMSEEEFEALWEPAIGEIKGRNEIMTGASGDIPTLRSTSLAKQPLSCAIRRHVRLTLERYIGQLVGVFLIVAAYFYAKQTIASSRKTEEQAKQLASVVLDRLQWQAAANAQDGRTFPEAWLSMGHLRDDVLRDEFSSSKRKKLWERVQKKVEGNSNVRSITRELRSGDYGRVWEWVGAIGAIEDTPGTSRKSGRFSLVGRVSDEGAEMKEAPGSDGSETTGFKKWEEGRGPYY